jgi:transposase
MSVMAGKKPQRYTPEFKRDAVALVVSSGRPIKEIARELGISDTTLGNWVRADPSGSKNEKGEAQEVDEEKRQLRRRVAELEKEREILKRAMAFWVKESNG